MNGQRKVAPSASAAARSLPNASGFWMSTSTTSCAPSREASAATSQPTLPAPMITTCLPVAMGRSLLAALR